MAQNRRRNLLVDRDVQGALLARAVVYWLLAISTIGLMVGLQVVAASAQSPISMIVNRTLAFFGPALMAAVLLLPILLLDCLRTSSKFVGPIHRLRQEMRNLADGRPVKPLKLRENDLYVDLADDFNRLADRVQGPTRAASSEPWSTDDEAVADAELARR